MSDCRHIIGFDKGYGDATEPEEYEQPKLVYWGDIASTDITFKFCPLCGGPLGLQHPFENIHPSYLPDGPERDAWLEAEAQYAGKHDPIRLPLVENEMCSWKMPRKSWLRRACAWMMR